MRKVLKAALLIGAAFAMTAGSALANVHATTRVENKTTAKVWITLYADVGAFGWAIEQGCRPAFAQPGWTCTTHTKDGPWRLRAEVEENGKRHDFITNYWYGGAQHKYTPGPDSWFFICKDTGGYYWSYAANCSTHNNS